MLLLYLHLVSRGGSNCRHRLGTGRVASTGSFISDSREANMGRAVQQAGGKGSQSSNALTQCSFPAGFICSSGFCCIYSVSHNA